jgi:hypothetical protein
MPPLRSAAAQALPSDLRRDGEESWWTRASALADARSNAEAPKTRYRFGDSLLELASESSTLLAELEERYGECAVPAVASDTCPRVRCWISFIENHRLAHVRFTEPGALDLFGVALTLLEHPVSAPLFAALPAAVDGWRVIVSSATDVPVIAARNREAIVDLAQAPAGFLVDLIVNPVLAAQRELLFVHAASVGVRSDGILLIGPSGSGKTTTALSLAARGHAYFGDDMAAIRIASTELLAFRSTANVRPGPHAPALTRHLEIGRWDRPHVDGIRRLRLRVADVFPKAHAAPLPLRRALFLRRFADAPAHEPFAPTLDALGTGSALRLNNALWLAWGTTPQRRLLQFMVFVRMLARVRCAWLDVGNPEATADLIETTMEDAWD